MTNRECNLSYTALGYKRWEEEVNSEVIPISHPKVDPFLCVFDRL